MPIITSIATAMLMALYATHAAAVEPVITNQVIETEAVYTDGQHVQHVHQNITQDVYNIYQQDIDAIEEMRAELEARESALLKKMNAAAKSAEQRVIRLQESFEKKGEEWLQNSRGGTASALAATSVDFTGDRDGFYAGAGFGTYQGVNGGAFVLGYKSGPLLVRGGLHGDETEPLSGASVGATVFFGNF